MKNRKKKGFTLVELVVVIAIIAILGAVSVVGYLGFVRNADKSAIETEAQQIKTVLIAGCADKDSGIKYNADQTGLEITYKKVGNPEALETTDTQRLQNYFFEMTEDEAMSKKITEVTENDPGANKVAKILYTTTKGTATITVTDWVIEVTLK